jgi:hypothetical protein
MKLCGKRVVHFQTGKLCSMEDVMWMHSSVLHKCNLTEVQGLT